MRVLPLLLWSASYGFGQEFVKETVPGLDGNPEIVLRNVSGQAAVAWLWESRSTLDRDHFGPGRTQLSGVDAVIGGSALAPGAMVTTHIAPGDPVGLDWGAIFADGSTAGDPKLVERILANRRAALGEIAEFRRMVEDALASAGSIESLRARMQSRRFPGTVGGALSLGPSMVAFRLSSILNDAMRLSEAGPRLLAELDRIRANLQGSKPPLI